jgi:thiol peroxidase
MKKILVPLALVAFLSFMGCTRVNVNVPSWRDFVPTIEREPQERTGEVTKNGEDLTLLGPEKKVGDKAPNFKAIDKSGGKVELKNFKGKVILIASIVSVDTKVCDIETRKFNEEAAKLPDVVLITISEDLPFALEHYCAAGGIDRIHVWSDHAENQFGLKYGVLIEEDRLLARAIFVINKDNRISYIQIVPELTHEPDYAAALRAVQDALKKQPKPND